MSDPRTAAWYSRFADTEARDESAIYHEWALGVAADAEVLAALEELPLPKRQPNLIFAVSRLLGAPEGDFADWHDWVLAHWAEVREGARSRSTQTNEPRRCAVILPALGLIEGPIALLEVGASAGLCLLPDRYSYSWNGSELHPEAGPSTVLLECATAGDPPLPSRMPRIVWRAGIDLNPLSVGDPEAVRWLETLVWPEQAQRRERLRAALAIAREDPPRVVRGDAVTGLRALAAEAPADATLVVVTSASIVYLTPADRATLLGELEALRALGARWISNEGPGIVPSVGAALEAITPPRPGLLALGLDGSPLAWTGGHGQRLDWIRPALAAPAE